MKITRPMLVVFFLLNSIISFIVGQQVERRMNPLGRAFTELAEGFAEGFTEELTEELTSPAEQTRCQALAQFEILRSRFYKRQGVLLEETIIELTVRNGTVYAISRAVFVGTLVSPGRSIPWNKESFSYQIRGGLEPGEEVTWQLEMGMFSGWDRLDAPGDAILTVEVKSLEGADGRDICVQE